MRVIVHFVDIGRIVHLYCLNFLFHSVGILSLAVFLNEFREHNFLYKKSSDTWFISIYKGPSWSVSYGSFNNIPVISRRSILSVKEPGENYRPAASH
jgi:hypothetical protein